MLIQAEKTKLVDVAIPFPIQDPYTYRLPANFEGRIQLGIRVRIPFRNRSVVGFVVGAESERSMDSVREVKEILEVLDSEPVVSEHLIRLAKWIGEYYFSSWGEAISNMIPKLLKPDKPRLTERQQEIRPASSIRLNDEQEKAFGELKKLIRQNQFAEAFLFGVTGGGKSELYIRMIKETLSRGKSAICLVPEIALTEQLELFFAHHFAKELEILHSKLTDRQRNHAWQRIRSGEKKVVLGARSAVFAPVQQLGLIVMDEEQETSYKQDQTPRYHAREVARWRARDLGALFVMGTATPTLETMQRASSGEVHLLKLTKRVDNKPMPEVKIIDLKRAADISKKQVIISSSLREAIERVLQIKRGVLLMLNRRGFSTHIRCLKCGDTLFCTRCAVALTYHQEEGEALCHYCNFHMEIPKLCAKCSYPLFKFSGIGTEKVESEVARLFPTARIARLDTDTARKKGSHEEILRQFRARQIDILVGTQMIAKGFDFRHVNLVGIVNADTGLLLPDFRSSERTFQLLTQMAGRTGRGVEAGMVMIQTFSPLHYAIQFSARHDYNGFFAEEIEKRRSLNYPPFSKLINVAFRGRKETLVREYSMELRQILEKSVRSDVELIGPAPLPLYRLRGHFRWHLMLRGRNTESLQTLLRSGLSVLKRRTKVHFAIDVDPITIL